MSLLPHILNGLTLGLLFALIALGFMLIIGVMEVINLAHGSLFALGAYFALWLVAPHLPVFSSALDIYNGMPIGFRYAIAVVVAPLVWQSSASVWSCACGGPTARPRCLASF